MQTVKIEKQNGIDVFVLGELIFECAPTKLLYEEDKGNETFSFARHLPFGSYFHMTDAGAKKLIAWVEDQKTGEELVLTRVVTA